MSKSYKRTVKIGLARIIVLLLVLAVLASLYWYYGTHDPKIEPLLAGLVSGLLVAIVQYVMEWYEHTEVEAIKKLGIKGIYAHRDDRSFYSKLIESAQREIQVLGNTASRFLEDFAHKDRADSKALTQAIARGVKVRILLPQSKHLSQEDQQRAEIAMKRMAELYKQSTTQFDYRVFDHAPAHSLVRVDDNCLIGPIFPHVKSKDTPTIHVSSDSEFVKEYLKYYEEEWRNANEPERT